MALIFYLFQYFWNMFLTVKFLTSSILLLPILFVWFDLNTGLHQYQNIRSNVALFVDTFSQPSQLCQAGIFSIPNKTFLHFRKTQVFSGYVSWKSFKIYVAVSKFSRKSLRVSINFRDKKTIFFPICTGPLLESSIIDGASNSPASLDSRPHYPHSDLRQSSII